MVVCRDCDYIDEKSFSDKGKIRTIYCSRLSEFGTIVDATSHSEV